MGRKTWESLPPRFRPLPGRKNIVITRDPQWQAPGAQRAVSLDEAIAACADTDTDTAWITGGAEIFRLAMPRADLAVVTGIGADYDGDTFAPALGADWHEVARERHLSPAGIPFDFVTYRRTAN
jgi:dihydrofolate reductase